MTMLAATLLAAAALTLNDPTVDSLSRLPSSAPFQPRTFAPASGPTCSGGPALDDASFENGYRFPFASNAQYVQLLAPTEYPSRLTRICGCWSLSEFSSMNFGLVVYDDNGPAGGPGDLIGSVAAQAAGAAFTDVFVGANCANFDTVLDSGGVYVGVQWNSALYTDFFVCADESTTTPVATMLRSPDAGQSWTTVTTTFPFAHALGLRGEFELITPAPDPEPPAGPWISSDGLPGFETKVRITAAGAFRQGTKVDDCITKTICVAGAIPSQPEIFVRVVGPKPNGLLWPTIVKFNTSQSEVWVRQVSTQLINYYKLAPSAADAGVLPGLFDSHGFAP